MQMSSPNSLRTRGASASVNSLACFPEQIASVSCVENPPGERGFPSHRSMGPVKGSPYSRSSCGMERASKDEGKSIKMFPTWMSVEKSKGTVLLLSFLELYSASTSAGTSSWHRKHPSSREISAYSTKQVGLDAIGSHGSSSQRCHWLKSYHTGFMWPIRTTENTPFPSSGSHAHALGPHFAWRSNVSDWRTKYHTYCNIYFSTISLHGYSCGTP